MEDSEVIGKTSGGSNTELEKFKRRLIRAVARMLIQEKRNEDEVWVGLKKETGCDCREIWNRMYALTVKKLERLLKAEDHVNKLPKAARMTITDWLMFDTVLVHDDVNVIGMSETTTTDKKVLEDLFDLVEKHKVEFLAGDALTDAWLRVTLQYNRKNRQCTPMLLQRRWYQLKLATRVRFYKFWSMYRGAEKRMHLGDPFKPTPLQAQIAKRYKPLVVSPFMLWEDLVKNNLVILPEAFELKGNITPSTRIDDVSPDVMCVEPSVETIELDDCDPEFEYRSVTTKSIQPLIKIKQEPKDEDDNAEAKPYESRHEKILQFAEAVMVATANELDEMELSRDADDFLSSNPEKVQSPLNEQDKTDVADESDAVEQENHDIVITPQEIEINKDITVTSEDDSITVIEDTSNVNSVLQDTTKDVCVEKAVNDIESIVAPVAEDDTKHVSATETVIEVDSVEDINTVDNDIEILKEPEPVLPQITSIFGGVDISNESLSKISLLTAQISNNPTSILLDTTPQLDVENTTSIEICNDSSDSPNKDVLVSDDNTHDSKSNCEMGGKISKGMWFGELSNDIEFADDGIQVIDDDIEDEPPYPMPIDTKSIKTEVKLENDEMEIEDIPKVDEKLLLVPVVKVFKLDDMGILPIHLLNHIDNKSLIDVIAFKNSSFKKTHVSAAIKQEVDIDTPLDVEIKLPVTIKQEINLPINGEINPPVTIKEEMDPSESSDEDIIDDSKKVKLSSRLLNKPRNLTYHPIQLCKNPDFNTRLKKLNIGFFGSARNRLLLKSCKPLSIDVSKSFENKLVNGIMYLVRSESNDTHLDTQPKEYSHNVSVEPSAMVVQSLIDNTKSDIPPASYGLIAFQSLEGITSNCQRNKVINLPDISEIRRINQKLLTAEVTPLRSKNDPNQVPVTLVATNRCTKTIPGPASRKKPLYPQVVDITKTDKDELPTNNTVIIKDYSKPTPKICPWKPRHKAEIPWFSNRNSDYSDDTLLALDSLNKMLFILTEEEGAPQVSSGKSKKKKNKQNKDRQSTLTSSSTAKPLSKDDDNDDVQIVSEIKLDNTSKKNREGKASKSGKATKLIYCCWARERICQLLFSKKMISKHNCPFPLCLCCCKAALIEFIKEKVKKTKSNTGAQTSDHLNVKIGENSSEDVAIIENNDQYVADVVPVIRETTDVATSETISGKEIQETEIPSIDTAVNADVEISINENANTALETSSKDVSDSLHSNTRTSTSTNEVAVNTNIDISTSEIGVTTDTEIVAIKSPVNTVWKDNSNREADSEISDTLDNTTIGAEISVITSKNGKSTKNYPIKVTSELPKCYINPATQPTPRIRIKSSMGKKNKQRIVTHAESLQINLNRPHSEPRKVFLNPFANMQQCTVQKSQNAGFVVDATTQSNIGSNQRMLYLNSKQISELPNDNPIFLGKNKILLTTATFPPNFKAFEAFQANIRQTLALPKGIQLILLPSGRLTYLRDRKKSVSDEFMATLPELIEAIQRQINGNIVTPSNNNLQTEIIDLSDDDTRDIIANTEQSEKEQTDIITHTEPTVKEHTNIVENTDETLKKQADIANTEHTDVSTNIQNTTNVSKTINDKEINTIESTTHVNPPSVANNVESVTSDVNTVEINSGKCNNILSDLMAMSGIEAQDITTTQETSQDKTPPMLQPTNTILDQNSLVQHLHTSTDDFTAGQPQPLDKNLKYTLTPITSLSDLKYACAQSSSFFKLDLETGIMLPINVCMKRFAVPVPTSKSVPQQSQTTEPIDLTDDDVSVVTQAHPKSLLIANQQVESNIENVEGNSNDGAETYFEVTNPSSQSDVNTGRKVDPNVDGFNITQDGQVKPLKLCKSLVVHPNLPVSKPKCDLRPNLLVRKLKEVQKRLANAKKEQDVYQHKLKRKQELKPKHAVETMNSPKVISSDDSSDEEPLAKKATKIRALENTGGMLKNVNKKHDDKGAPLNNSASDTEMELIDELPDTVDEQLPDAVDKQLAPDPNINVPMEEDEDMTLEYLDETQLLEENEPDDDCILGV